MHNRAYESQLCNWRFLTFAFFGFDKWRVVARRGGYFQFIYKSTGNLDSCLLSRETASKYHRSNNRYGDKNQLACVGRSVRFVIRSPFLRETIHIIFFAKQPLHNECRLLPRLDNFLSLLYLYAYLIEPNSTKGDCRENFNGGTISNVVIFAYFYRIEIHRNNDRLTTARSCCQLGQKVMQ